MTRLPHSGQFRSNILNWKIKGYCLFVLCLLPHYMRLKLREQNSTKLPRSPRAVPNVQLKTNTTKAAVNIQILFQRPHNFPSKQKHHRAIDGNYTASDDNTEAVGKSADGDLLANWAMRGESMIVRNRGYKSTPRAARCEKAMRFNNG